MIDRSVCRASLGFARPAKYCFFFFFLVSIVSKSVCWPKGALFSGLKKKRQGEGGGGSSNVDKRGSSDVDPKIP